MQLAPNNGTVALGLVPFKPASTLVAEERAKQTALSNARAALTQRVTSSLSSHIEDCWTEAKIAKQEPEQQMLKNQRQRAGTYEQDKLAAISDMGGSAVYVLLTGTKCRAAMAWLNDLLRPAGDKLWGLKPTPVAELPGDIYEQMLSEAEAVGAEATNRAYAMGAQAVDPDVLGAALREYMGKRRDELAKEVQREAEIGVERMSLRMEDQLQEGGWHKAFWEMVDDLVSLKAGIIKGPVVRRRKVMKWVQIPGGKWTVRAQEAFVPEFYRVSPFDLYPSPGSRHPNDGYLIERQHLSRPELQALIGVRGYSSDNIRAVLREYGSGLSRQLAIDSERAPLDFSGHVDVSKQFGGKLEALEFWGPVPGKMLLDWGLQEPGLDPDLDYEVNAWKIGQYVIRAVINPDKLGRKPYSVDSWERVPGSFWGRGLPEQMSDVQDVCNSLARSIVNNAGIASGPQVEVNTDRLAQEDDDKLYPWRIWKVTNAQMLEAPAVRFTSPQCIVEPLLRVFDHFSTLAEDQTGIPRWAYGRSDVGGAGGTSSGLSMLMTSASRGIKEVVSHVDAMTSSCIERLYDYNMAYDEDDFIKRDCRVVARGSTAILQREQRQQQLNQLLAQTNNPEDMKIIGYDGRAKLLAEAIKTMDIDATDVVPDKDKLTQLVEKIEQEQAQLLAMGQNPGQGKGVAPSAAMGAMDPAGRKAGGEEASLFRNMPAEAGGTPTYNAVAQ